MSYDAITKLLLINIKDLSLPKHNFITWLVVKRRIKTRELLQHRGVILDVRCELCLKDIDSVDHLFFCCEFTKAVWVKVLQKLNCQHQPREWQNEWRWIQRKGRGRSRKANMISAAFSATIYYVWEERNGRIFRHTQKTEEGVYNLILSFLRLRF